MLCNKLTTKFLLLATISALFISPAVAHRFNVTLLLPLSGPNAQQGNQFLNGFMLATRERDGHPEEESDGHLGGLDVYVTRLDDQTDIDQQIALISSSSQIDIVAYFPSADTTSALQSAFDQSHAALLTTGENPFSDAELPGVAAFSSQFLTDYNAAPTEAAAQGYNLARRIDVAVRAQGGVSDLQNLLESFEQSASNFSW